MRHRTLAILVLPILGLLHALSTCLAAAPGTGAPLPLTRGEVHHVASMAEFKAALETANRGKTAATLLLADGTYLLDGATLEIQCPGLVIRSASGNRDAVRWYFKDEHILAKARRVIGPDARIDGMDMAETRPLPDAIIPIANSRLILAADRAGFLVDCGGMNIVAELRKLRAAGRLTSIEHVFVTHYHDDHTDTLPALVAEFGAKVHACGSLVDLIERPGDYRLPCLTQNPTAVTAKHRDGDRWRWKEYQFTIFDYPGQTLHHNALLVERDGAWSACFVGDSFTPSGIDDYCLQNRNFLHEGQGYFRCLDQLEQLPAGCFLINQHVEPAFRFSPAQIAQMRETLRRRIPLLSELLPFEDPNYGLDESWAVLHPYWLTRRPGQSAPLALRITNHSPRELTFQATARAPQGFHVTGAGPVRIAPRSAGALTMTVEIPSNCLAGLHLVTVDISREGAELRDWTEAVLDVIR